ncbi:hypothetical protein ACVBGC_01385 [Burkholderia stagnalis]
MFRKISNAMLELRQREHATPPSAERKAPEADKQKGSLHATPPPSLAGLGPLLSRSSTGKSKAAPSDWGAEARAALDAVAQSGGERTTGFTVRKQPLPRPKSSLDASKLKGRPRSVTDTTDEIDTEIVDTTGKVDPPEPAPVPAVVATTLHKTETAPVAKTTKAAETDDTSKHDDHVARLAYAFERFFPDTDTHEPAPRTSSVMQSPAQTKTSDAPVVADVAPEKAAEQIDATRRPNERFGALLEQGGMAPIRNSGKGNNCAIYSLVQCAAPDLHGPDLDHAVGEIRAAFDATHPNEAGRMLLLDANEGGHGEELVSLVNGHFSDDAKGMRVDMQVGVVQAGVDDAHPVTTLCQLHGSQRQPGQAPTHRIVVWDQHGHFEAIAGKPARAAVETAIDETEQKPASLSEAKDTKAPPLSTPVSPSTSTSTSTKPVTTPVAKKTTGSPRTSESKSESVDKSSGKKADGTPPPKKTSTDEALPRPHGEALGQLVPDVTKSAKALRKFGRMIRVDNENALPQLLNRTKPEGGIVQGLAKAHVTTSAPSGLAIAHESVNTVYAAQELGTSAMRKRRYQARLNQWPASADEPKITTGGREAPLSEVARMTDFQSRYDLKVAILREPEDSPAREKMLDVLTGRYIAEVQGKNRVVRAAIRTTMSAMGIGATVGLAVGTHGAAPAALAGGAILSGRDLIDNRKAAHSLKQHYRDKKMAAIVDGAMRERVDKQLAGEPGKDEKANWGGVRDQVNQQNIKRFVPIKFDRFDENKSTDNKKQEVDLVKKHAAARVAGVIDESNGRHSLREAYLANSGVRKKELKQFHRDAVRLDTRADGRSDIASSVQLMRDLGMSKMEAITHLRRAAVGSFTHPKLDEDERKRMKDDPDPIVREMAQSPSDRLESAIGSAMGRR